MQNWTPRFKTRLLEMGVDPDKVRGSLVKEGWVVIPGFINPEAQRYVTEGLDDMVGKAVSKSDPSGEASNGGNFKKMYAAFKAKFPRAPEVFKGGCHTDDLFDLFFDPNMLDVMTCSLGTGGKGGAETRLLPGYRVTVGDDVTELTGPWHQEYHIGIKSGGEADAPPADVIQAAMGKHSTGGMSAVGCITYFSGGFEGDGASIEVLPRTHELGPLAHAENADGEEHGAGPGRQVADEITGKYDNAVQIELGQGDVLLFSMFTIKRSVGKARWHASWAYQMAIKAPTLWGGAEGFIARSDDDCDMEVQSGSEWLGMRYSGM